jgi:hypothetical protein
MLSILDARSAVRYPASDLVRYGLDKPQAALTLDDQRFAYGAINNMTREQYVATGDAVYLVPLAYITALPRNADSVLALRVFASDEKPVRFTLPQFTVGFGEGKWTVTPQADDRSADERNAWVDAWVNAAAIRAEHTSRAASPEQITVDLRDGRTITLSIQQREPELVLLRHDERVEYHLFAEAGKRLIAPPGAPQKAAAKPAEQADGKQLPR